MPLDAAMSKRLILSAAILLQMIQGASAADVAAIQPLFAERFYSAFEPRHCGRNVYGLIDESARASIDLLGAEIWIFRNEGGSMFGYLNVERARGEGPRGLSAGDMNWEFHVVLVAEGVVFDASFEMEPTPLPVRDYLKVMFLEDNPSGHRVPVSKKLDGYSIERIPVEAYLASKGAKLKGPKSTFQQVLTEY